VDPGGVSEDSMLDPGRVSEGRVTSAVLRPMRLGGIG
jgi:hypothetical protein